MSKKIEKESDVEYKGERSVLPLKVSAFEVINGDCEDPRKMLRDVSSDVQKLKNHLIFAWRKYHCEQGTDVAVSEWLREYRLAAAGDQKKPKCPTYALTAESKKYIYREIKDRFPRVHSRVLALSMNSEFSDLQSRKAAKSAFNRWHQILSDQGEQPIYSRPQPIPFDKQNANFIQDDGQWYLETRVDRFARTTQNGKAAAAATLLRLKIFTTGRKCGKVRAALEKCRSGEWKFCGSSLVEKERGWYVMMTYRESKIDVTDVDKNKTAVLRASKRHPWSIRIDGRTSWVMTRGRLVARVRRMCGDQRATRNESYRYASKARKGHGRKRAVYDVKNREDNFKKTYNSQTAAETVQRLVDAGAGTLYFRTPRCPHSRYLITAGAGARPGLWPWNQLEIMLKTACDRAGIELKNGVSKPKTSRKTAKNKAVNKRKSKALKE